MLVTNIKELQVQAHLQDHQCLNGKSQQLHGCHKGQERVGKCQPFFFYFPISVFQEFPLGLFLGLFLLSSSTRSSGSLEDISHCCRMVGHTVRVCDMPCSQLIMCHYTLQGHLLLLKTQLIQAKIHSPPVLTYNNIAPLPTSLESIPSKFQDYEYRGIQEGLLQDLMLLFTLYLICSVLQHSFNNPQCRGGQTLQTNFINRQFSLNQQ